MTTNFVFALVAAIIIFIVIYRKDTGENAYKYISRQVSYAYEQYAPYSFKVVRDKVKELGQEYTSRQYTIQIVIFAASAAIISYLYFYSLPISLLYAVAAVSVIPYLTYLRCKRLYSEFLFEQVQVYTTNTIMEFATTQSFVKSLEGVYNSGVLEDPIKSDVKMMIDLAYTNGTIEQSLEYMNDRYNYYIVKNRVPGPDAGGGGQDQVLHRRRPGPGFREECHARCGLHLPCRRLEAGALLRVLPHGGGEDQCDRYGQCAHRRHRGRRQGGHLLVHRQGCLSRQCHGHLQGHDGEGDRGEVPYRVS